MKAPFLHPITSSLLLMETGKPFRSHAGLVPASFFYHDKLELKKDLETSSG